MSEYVFTYRTATDGHGNSRTQSVRAASIGEAWGTFRESHAGAVIVWAQLADCRRPLFS